MHGYARGVTTDDGPDHSRPSPRNETTGCLTDSPSCGGTASTAAALPGAVEREMMQRLRPATSIQ
jgi:hypothetical protein